MKNLNSPPVIGITDDDSSSLLLMSAILRAAGYTVIAKQNSKALIQEIEARGLTPDLLMLNPLVESFAASKYLTEHDSEIPTVAITMNTGLLMCDMVGPNGFARILVKPFQMEEVLKCAFQFCEKKIAA
jgi:DNA-binding NtrC family response regulator